MLKEFLQQHVYLGETSANVFWLFWWLLFAEGPRELVESSQAWWKRNCDKPHLSCLVLSAKPERLRCWSESHSTACTCRLDRFDDSTWLDLTRQSQSWQTSNQLESPSQPSVLNTFKLDVADHAGPASGKLAAMRNITCASVTPKNGAKRYKCASMFLSKSLCHKVNLVGSIIVGCIRVSQQVLKSIRPCLVGDNNSLVRPQWLWALACLATDSPTALRSMLHPLHIPSCALRWENLPAAVPQQLTLPSVSSVGRMILFCFMLVSCSNSCLGLSC